MLAIRATFDGTRILLPPDTEGLAPGQAIVIFENDPDQRQASEDWLRAQEPAFRKAWENDEDGIYDSV